MDYTDFGISASDIGTLLGCFGSIRQFQVLCKIWSKSTFKETCFITQNTAESWERETIHLHKLGIDEIWRETLVNIPFCTTQDDVQQLKETAFKLLFHNTYISTMIKQTKVCLQQNSLSSGIDETINTIEQVVSCSDTYFDKLQELHEKRKHYGFDCLHALLGLLDQSAKMCYGVTTRSQRAYGTNGERKFIEAFNKVHRTPITRVPHLHTKTMTEHEVGNGQTWCIKGRIDGMHGDNLVEIKHRRASPMERVPVYELIQLHAYMFLFNKPTATVIQCVRTTELMYSESITIFFCLDFWAMVTDRIKTCLEFILTLDQHSLSRDALFGLSDTNRSDLLLKYLGVPVTLDEEAYLQFLRP